MSGHSKWANIQDRKTGVDAKRAQQFSKLSKAITVAAKEGGGDPTMNIRLRAAIDAARSASMPKDNIERAIKRGAGGDDGIVLEEVVYEGFGPGGVAMVIVCVTDNRTRTVAEVKYLMSKNGGSVGGPGSVMWMFDKKGIITVKDAKDFSDDYQLEVISAGADEIEKDDQGNIHILCEVSNINNVVKVATTDDNSVSVTIGYIPKECTSINDSARSSVEKLIEVLEENDDVDAVYTNI